MMGLSCELRVAPEIRVTQEVTAEIAEAANVLRTELKHSAAEGLRQVMERLANSQKTTNDHTSNEIQKIISDPVFQELLIQYAGGVVQENYDWRGFAASYRYFTDCVQNGDKFKVQKLQADGSYLTQDIPLDEGLFKQAVLEPEKLQEEIARLDKAILALENQGNGTADLILNLTHERQQQIDALNIAQAYSERIKKVSDLVSNYLLNKKLSNVLEVQNFLYDTYILSKLDFYVSERLIKRFCNSSFKGIKPKSPITESFQTAALNSAAEFVLISLGIINPEIFCLQKGEILPKKTKAFEEFCHELNIDPNTLAEHYKIQTSGTFFWNRYFVQGMKPSKETEQKIRNFITGTFRDHSAEILEAMQFETVFENIKSQLPAKKGELKSILNEALLSILGEEAFQNLVIQKVSSQEWRQALAGLVV